MWLPGSEIWLRIGMVTRRRFSKTTHMSKLSRREDLEAALQASTESLLKAHDPTIHMPAVRIASVLVSTIAAQIAVTTQTTQRSFKAIEDDITEYASDFVAQLIDDANRKVEGKLSSFRPARRQSHGGAKIELADDWAGPVAGPTVIERHYGIPRSTLYRWQKLNEAVAISTRSSRKPVFPLKQFVNGRPVDGLSQVISIFGKHDTAWEWLMQPNPLFDQRTSIDALLEGEVEAVLNSAKDNRNHD